jgi:apolipoprotein N-acyltransferase
VSGGAGRRARLAALGLAAIAGALAVGGFAPFHVPALAVVAFALLAWLVQRADGGREGAWLGFAFGAGLFGVGVAWLTIALETFGGMPAPLAVVAVGGLCAYLALYPALAAYVAARFAAPGSWARALAFAGAFAIAEWLRGWVFTGFPWLALGYSQLPGSPLAGLAPVGGVWLVSLAVALVGAAAALAVDALEARRVRHVAAVALLALACTSIGALLGRIEWTVAAGEPLAVSLVQGDVAQDRKFDPAFREATFDLYTGLAQASRGRLVVLPESAFPMAHDEVPQDVVDRLARVARERGGDLLLGLFVFDPPLPGERQPRVYNSVVSLGASPVQVYRKRHLVPFGETIPLKPVVGWLMNHVLSIPIGDQARGADDQPPFALAGGSVAVNICYEDAFGEELRFGAANAGLLVNVTNDAWYGRSIAARQHNQIAAMRALELGRPMLRATNTGITSAIDHRGRVVAELPWFTRGILEVEVAGRTGDTPYLRHGDAIALATAALVLALGLVPAGRARGTPTAGR